MAKGNVMDGSAGMSPRKAMASGMGDGGGNFGVKSFMETNGGMQHPDHKMGTGAKGHMRDGERGIGGAITHTKGMHPAQAAPDHGPTHPSGHGKSHSYGGKA